EDESLRAVILVVDSRGGSALASELVRRAVRRLADKKPVVAFVDQVAASGGYMVAVAAHAIVATPTSIVGSIGVFGGKFEISGLLDKLGVGRAVLKQGRNAALESGFTPWTDDERAALDREIEQTYRDFLGAVGEGRKRPVEEIEPLAGGRIYTGRRAKELGLVDELGGFEAALAKAQSLAGVLAQPDVVAIEAPSSPMAALTRVRGLAEVRDLLGSLAGERVFALDQTWLRIHPKP
ncbi:MAG: signal peptide peptidase SppA, partial [Deltaproteobacteria bacterium]|nr:signal peptide peptidase SppA [Deltaproteobacteria bacterium]